MSRIKNTKRNIVASYACTICTYLFQFISRTVINYSMGREYLGISSLFTSIIQILSMAELGFAGAIVYNMYKPLAENDIDTVCALLNYYKKIYRVVGFTILLAGIIIMPFIPKLIKGSLPDNLNIYIVYFLFLTNTVVSYFLFSYKTSLIEALQRLDLEKLSYFIVSIFQYCLQIIAIAVFKNFYLYIVVLICSTALKNVFVAIIAKRKFPQYSCHGSIDNETKEEIKTRVKGLLVCNICGVTSTTLDSIIISATIGLGTVAIYNNYIIVFNTISSIIIMIRQSMQASVANSVATENEEKNYHDMLRWQFMFSIIASFCAICMTCIYQPFMTVWMGSDMLLPMRDVILLVIWFFIGIIQHSYYLYLAGNGLWWEMRWPYICNTLCNLVLNIVLGKYFGTTGIIFASLFATFAFGVIWQRKIIFKIYFNKSSKKFLLRQALYFGVCAIGTSLCYELCQYINLVGIMGLCFKIVISIIFSIVFLIVAYFKTPMFKDAKTFTKNIIKIH